MDNEETHQSPADMDPEDLPDVRAFQDEFTRSFLQSTEETRPGYYPFLSGTGAFTMDFPAEGVIGERGYAVKESDYEGLLFGVSSSQFNSIIQIDYYEYIDDGDEVNNLNQIESNFGGELEFKKENGLNQTLYIASFQDENYTYGYAAYLQNNNKSGGIHIFYDSDCVVTEDECKKRKEQEMNKIYDWMNSITFVQDSGESE